MKQISKRITYLFSLRREKIGQVLKKYDMKEYEYYLLLEFSFKKEISFDELLKIQQFNKNLLYAIIQSLQEKGYIIIQNDNLHLTDKFYKVEKHINYDLEKIDHDFSKQMNYKEYSQYINVLDELIDYYEEIHISE